jgi:hypothetical protein
MILRGGGGGEKEGKRVLLKFYIIRPCAALALGPRRIALE